MVKTNNKIENRKALKKKKENANKLLAFFYSRSQ